MLTLKQERFVQELIKGKSQREAYRIAYPGSAKWKESSVDCKASILFSNGKVKERYDELFKEAQKEAILDAVEMRKKLIQNEMAIMDADPTDYYNMSSFNGHATLVLSDDFKSMDHRAIKKITFASDGTPILEFYDKQKAHDHLAQWYGLAEKEEEKSQINIVLEKADGYDV